MRLKVTKEGLEKKIKSALNISFLEIKDQSHLHSNHYIPEEGQAPDSLTHVKLIIKSFDFEGKTKIETHRLIHQLLHEELTKGGLHALSLELKA